MLLSAVATVVPPVTSLALWLLRLEIVAFRLSIINLPMLPAVVRPEVSAAHISATRVPKLVRVRVPTV